MFLSNKLDQYPHLAIFLRASEQRRKRSPKHLTILAGVVLGVSALVGFISVLRGDFLGWLGMLVPAGIVGGWLWAQQGQVPEPQDELRLKADEVAGRMSACLEHRRLHRDLDENSLILLEEAARHWHRVQLAISNPHWETAAPHLAGLREQVARAADNAMYEVVTLFGPLLPQQVTGRGFLDYAEEFAEGVFHTQKPPRPVPAAFEPARVIVEKLRELGNEMESRATRPGGLSLGAEAPAPGLSIDIALSELRHLERAETELRYAPDEDDVRQNLTG